MSSIRNKRIAKEVRALATNPPEGISLHSPSGADADDGLNGIVVLITVPDHPLYRSTYPLSIKFPPTYPIDSPTVIFTSLQPPLGAGGASVGSRSNGSSAASAIELTDYEVPVHPHVYSNDRVGHICLDVLYSGWSPVQTASSIAISIQSMLASNNKLEKPRDNDDYVSRGMRDPKQTRWMFHDDAV